MLRLRGPTVDAVSSLDTLEIRLEEKGVPAEWKEILRGLDNLQQVEVRLQGKSFLMRSQLCGDALPALRAAGAALPPTIQEVE